jgi:hypothetical protein
LSAQLQRRSEVFSNSVDSRLLCGPIEIRAEPSVGSLASHLRQVGQIVPVCIELVEGAQLGHHVGGLNAVYQHPLHRVVADLAGVGQLGNEAIAGISRISEQLKLISLIRFMISLAVVAASPARVE